MVGVVASMFGSLNFTDVASQDSTAGNSGGVVYLADGDAFFADVTVERSTAAYYGGVIHAESSNVSFVNVSTQDSTSSYAFGGVVYSYDGYVNFVDVATRNSIASGKGGVVFCELGAVTFVHVTAYESKADLGGFVCSQFGYVSFANVTSQGSIASSSGGFMYSYNSNADMVNVSVEDHTATFEGVSFFFSGGQLVVQESTAISSFGGAVYGGRPSGTEPTANLTLERLTLSCSGSTACVTLEGQAQLTATDIFLSIESGVGISAEKAKINVNYSTLSGGPGAVALMLSSSTCVLAHTAVVVQSSGLGVLSLFSSMNLTGSTVRAGGTALALFSVSGDGTLLDSLVVCDSNSAMISAGTTWDILSCVLVGALPFAPSKETLLADSFVGSTAVDAPALSCNAATFISSSIVCGGAGALTSPAGTCADGTTGLGAGQLTCHDACFNSSFCVPDLIDGTAAGLGSSDGGRGAWFDSLGCPRCEGACWLGTNNCSTSLAYCYDAQDGGFTCECRTGYSGDGVHCQDIDECLEPDACSNPLADCLNSIGSFTCPCRQGFILVGGLCQDVNECETGADNCVPSTALCVNTLGSFVCECDAGAYGDGTVECTQCPAHSTTFTSGATSLEDCLCVGGLYGSNGSCTACPALAETSGDDAGATSLADCLCPLDFYLNTTTCEACPGNSSSVVGALGASACFCEPFYYREVGAPAEAPCVACPAGRFALNERQCLVCPSGTYSVAANASSCLSCPPGSGTNLQVGAQTCTCFPNYNSSGSGENLACTQSCPPGWQTAGAFCQVCGAGSYSQTVNSPRCTRCPPGASTATSTAFSPTECECLEGRLNSSSVDGVLTCPLNCSVGTSYVGGLDQCVPCQRGSYWDRDTETSLGLCSSCPPNSNTIGLGSPNISACLCDDGFAYDERRGWCAVQCGPGFAVQATSCELCGPGTYSDQANSLSCASCPANTLTQPGATSRSACSCVAGFFLEATSGECMSCPSGASCAGGSLPPTAESGYFEGDQGTFVACVPETACAGGGACLDGYEGSLCAACSEGYFRLDGYCRPCSGSRSVFATCALLALLCVCVSLVLYNLGEESASEGVKASFGGLFIAFNSFQVIAMFGQLEIAWPPLIRQLLAALSLVFTFNVEVVGIECFRRSEGNGDGDGDGSVHPFVLSWVVGMLAPLYVALSLLVGHFLLNFLHRCTPCAPTLRGYSGRSLLERLRRSASVSFVQALLLLYFPLTVGVFEAFQCVDNGLGIKVLASSRDVPCSGSHYSFLLGAGVVATFVYVVSIPAFLLGGVYWLKSHNSEADLYDKAEVLVGKYRGPIFWYEGVVLLRKAAVAAVLLLLTPSPYVRAAAGAAVLLTSFTVNRVLAPYNLRWHNWIECSSLLSTVVFLEVGIAMQGTQWSDAAKIVVAVLSLLVALAIVIGAAGYELWWAQRVWRGLATDELSIRVYDSDGHARSHHLASDNRKSSLRTLGARGEEMDLFVSVAPPLLFLEVPGAKAIVTAPSPSQSVTELSMGEKTVVTTPHVPPPPSLGHLGAIELWGRQEVTNPPPPASEPSFESWSQLETIVPPPPPPPAPPLSPPPPPASEPSFESWSHLETIVPPPPLDSVTSGVSRS